MHVQRMQSALSPTRTMEKEKAILTRDAWHGDGWKQRESTSADTAGADQIGLSSSSKGSIPVHPTQRVLDIHEMTDE